MAPALFDGPFVVEDARTPARLKNVCRGVEISGKHCPSLSRCQLACCFACGSSRLSREFSHVTPDEIRVWPGRADHSRIKPWAAPIALKCYEKRRLLQRRYAFFPRFGGQRYSDSWRKLEEARSRCRLFPRKPLKGLARHSE